MEIEGHHLEVEVNTNRIIGEHYSMSILIEMTLGETTLEKCKIIELKILEVDIEIITEMTTSEEVRLEKGITQVILEEIIEAVADQDQAQEPVLIERELDTLSVGNMIILLKTIQLHKQKKKQNKYNECII